MKQRNGMWHFESYEEIKNYLAQGLNRMCHYVYLTTMQKAWINDAGKVVADTNEEGEPYVFTQEDLNCDFHNIDRVVNRNYSIRAEVGSIEDYPAEDYAVKKVWKVTEFEAGTVVEGFYKAGEHLARHIHTVGEKRTSFTTKELTAKKNGVETEYDDEGTVYYYRIKAKTGTYECHQGSLWQLTAAMEKAEGVSPAKRKAFHILGRGEALNSVALRLSFTIDKTVPKLKKCVAHDELRPVLNNPIIETSSGIMVASDGHILAAYKLQDYEADSQGGLPAKFVNMVSIPNEVFQMKGRVTIEAVEDKWEESVCNKDGSSELKEVEGIVVTACDESGKQGVVMQSGRYANWRSVMPNETSPAISLDTKKMTVGLKSILPQLCEASKLVMLTGKTGDKSLTLYGEDIDFSLEGKVMVELADDMPCDMKVGLKATKLIDCMGFDVKTMHYKGSTNAVLFLGPGTILLQMPMLLNEDDAGKGPKPTKWEKFDVDEHMEKQTKTQTSKAKPKPKAKPQPSDISPQTSTAEPKKSEEVRSKRLEVRENHQPSDISPQTSTAEPTLADRLRAALLKQIKQSA